MKIPSKEYQREWSKKNKAKKREYARRWREKNKSHVQEYNKKWWALKGKKYSYDRIKASNIREHVLFKYGGSCSCCKEDAYEFLCIDHVNGGGKEHRKKVGIGYTFYKWIINNNYPKDLRVLCHNCNMALGLYGYCPHNRGPTSRDKN